MGCGDEEPQYETLNYRPKQSQKTTDPLKRDQEQIIHPDVLLKHLINRPYHMPCQAFEELTNNKVRQDLFKFRYSYDKDKRLGFSDYFKKKSMIEPDDISMLAQDTQMWKIHYQYDDKNRLIRYLLLTERDLLQKWVISYTPVKNGTQVKIVGDTEPQKCLLDNETSPRVGVRTCTTPIELTEEITFLINSRNQVVNGRIWSSIKKLPKGTKLEFKYKKENPYMGQVMFFGRDLVVGQSQTLVRLPDGKKMDLLKLDYDLSEKGSISKMYGYGAERSHLLTTTFTAGSPCDNL